MRTTDGDVGGDHVVLAAGAWTTPLAGKLGVRVPMQPGKGYSFLLRPKLMPRHGILFADIHAGATPLGDRVRIGGTMEFSGYDLSIDERRIGNLFRLARDYVDLETPGYEEPWAGLRPTTVDGLPILDRAGPFRNASIATGYSMLGMTLSAPAGEAMAEMIVSGRRPEVFEPFRLDRFPRWIIRRRRALDARRAEDAAAVDADHRTGHPLGVLVDQVADPAGDLIGLTDASQRDEPPELALAGLGIRDGQVDLGGHRAGADADDPDPVGCQLGCQVHGQVLDRRLGQAVDGLARAGT